MFAAAETLLAFTYIAPFVWQVLLGLLVLAYAAHSFLLVLQETAAGADEITWPTEPWLDWLGKLVHLALLVGAWLWAIYYLCWRFEAPRAVYFLATVAFFWLVFPVSLLSSLSATSRWMVLRPVLLWHLLRRGGALAVFYALSGCLMLLSSGVFSAAVLLGYVEPPPVDPQEPNPWLLKLVIVLGQIALLPVAGLVGAVGLLVYARLLGRLGWLLNQGNAPAEDEEDGDETDDEEEPATAEAAAEEAPETYRLVEEPVPALAAPEEADSPFLSPQDVVAIAQMGAGSAGRVSENMAVLLAAVPPAAPAADVPAVPAGRFRPFVTGVFSFPWYRTTLKPLIWLSIGFLILDGMLCLLVSLSP